MHIYFSFKKE